MRWWQRSGNEQNKLIGQPVGCSAHLPFLTLTRPQRITLRRLDDISVSPVLEVSGNPLKQSFTHTHMPPHPSPEQVLLKQGVEGPLAGLDCRLTREAAPSPGFGSVHSPQLPWRSTSNRARVHKFDM